MRLVLASASPRRRELLSQLYAGFDCCPTDIDETPFTDEPPIVYVERLATGKAMACSEAADWILAADTTVAIGSRILGKPVSRHDAHVMLTALSDTVHTVHTGIALRWNGRLETRVISSEVQFAPLDSGLIERYLDTSEPWDKAGAYGIQGFAGSFVKQLRGSYSAVVGLPLCETRELLEGAGLLPSWQVRADG